MNILTYFIFLTSICSIASVEFEYLEKKDKFLEKEIQSRNTLSELYKTQVEIKKLYQDKSKAQQAVKKSEENITELVPLVERAERSLLEQKIQIQKRLIYIMKFQDMSFLKILFSSQTPTEMDRNLRILKGLTERDYISLKKYFVNVKALKDKKEELVQRKQQLESLMKDFAKKEDKLKSKLNEKSILISEIEKQQKNLIQSLKKTREKNASLSQEKKEFLDTLFEPLFFERKGSLVMPVQGQIIQKYGLLEHPTFKTQFRHKGVFIRTLSGASVLAVARGKVSYKGILPGLGEVLVIDHGDHYFSVYSNLSNIILDLNQEVNENQIFAQVGAQSPFLGEGLYFELRHFSEPVDPLEWFTKSKVRGYL